MLVLVAVPMLSAMALVGAAGDMKVIRTTNVGDVVMTVLGATDGWTTGDNAFALEFDSAQRKRLVDVDAPALTATALAVRSERLRASARLAAGLILVATFGFTPSRAEAYRPFMSTDAAVADPKALELELGHFTLRRERGESTFLIPSAVLNYGLWRNLELVAEFRVARGPSDDVDLIDPAVFVKAVIKEGVLQEHNGIGVAIEAGPLLPSTVRGERGAGFEAIGIVSGRVAPFTVHVNVGGGIDRSAAKPFSLWGVIGELPVHPRLRVVTEVAGEHVADKFANNSALLGVIWQPSSKNVYWDVGVRRGMTRGAPDWEVTTGITFAVRLPPARSQP